MGERDTKSERYKKIFAVVRRIPKGRVATYGQIATLAGLPRHARLVGYALHSLEEGSKLPWHRVVGAPGRISLPEGSESHYEQRARLTAEGIDVDVDGRLSLRRHQWKPRV
ncbi:MAG: MGMT family protein [Planctomycetota bacterium]